MWCTNLKTKDLTCFICELSGTKRKKIYLLVGFGSFCGICRHKEKNVRVFRVRSVHMYLHLSMCVPVASSKPQRL